MPLYEYRCEACGSRFEAIRKLSDSPLEVCTLCGSGPVHRLVSSPAIQFKGTGWYITDYSRKGKPSGESPGAADDKPRGADEKKAPTDASNKTADSAGTKSEAATPPSKPASGGTG